MRIDKLVPGTEVTLQFVGRWGNDTREESAEFVALTGEGDDRRATFRSDGPRGYEWDAYRYQGRWVYGTSADPLRVLEVVA